MNTENLYFVADRLSQMQRTLSETWLDENGVRYASSIGIPMAEAAQAAVYASGSMENVISSVSSEFKALIASSASFSSNSKTCSDHSSVISHRRISSSVPVSHGASCTTPPAAESCAYSSAVGTFTNEGRCSYNSILQAEKKRCTDSSVGMGANSNNGNRGNRIMTDRIIFKCLSLYGDIQSLLNDSSERLERLYSLRDSEISNVNLGCENRIRNCRARLNALEEQVFGEYKKKGVKLLHYRQNLEELQHMIEEADAKYKRYCAGNEYDENKGNFIHYISTGRFLKYMQKRYVRAKGSVILHGLTPITHAILYNGYSARSAYITRRLTSIRAALDQQTLNEVEKHKRSIAEEQRKNEAEAKKIREQYEAEEKRIVADMCVKLSLLIAKINAFNKLLSTDNLSWGEKHALLKKGRVPSEHISLGSQMLSLEPYREFAALITKYGIESDISFKEEYISVPLCFKISEDLSFNVIYDNVSKDDMLSAVNAFLLKLISSHLPQQIKLSLCDPEQLGQSFVPFLSYPHDAGARDTVVICSDANDISAHLGLLRKEINRIQTSCLQDRYASIHEYNNDYPNSPIPTRILVYAGYPAGKNHETEGQLLSIINLGPRCGIHTIVLSPSDNDDAVKVMQHLLTNINSEDDPMLVFGDHSIHIGFSNHQISVPACAVSMPGRDIYHPVIEQIAQNNAGAAETIISLRDIIDKQHYVGSSEKQLEIPFGMRQDGAIATVRMGNVASGAQQMLVVGRPRSGKSVFLHMLILSALARYDADELLLYLIDMKKGVEFQDYARSSLPQLQVVAIESDREFAYSVIRHAADLMDTRAALFKQEGVENIEMYRRKSGKKMPHVLIIIDEYQEIIQSGDKLGNSAAESIDLIVRTAGAFGIHLVLCSQTSVTAANMKTISKHMTVRLALACDRTVAGQIMSDDLSGSSRNSAIDLLPTFSTGQAVYNDNSGAETANQFLHVAYMSAEDRRKLLSELEALSVGKIYKHSKMHIAFAGNVRNRTSDIKDHPFTLASKNIKYSSPDNDLRFIVGDAYGLAPYFAIKPNISARHNVVVVSDVEDTVASVMVNAAMSAALSGDKVYSVMLSMARKSGARSYASVMGKIDTIGCGYTASRPADAGAVLCKALAELEYRMNANDLPEKQSAVFVWGLHDIENLNATSKIMNTASSKQPAQLSSAALKYLTPEEAARYNASLAGADSSANSESQSIYADITAYEALCTLITEGPKYGMHIFASCDTVSSLTSSPLSNLAQYFNHRICGAISSKEFSVLMSHQLQPKAPESAMLYYDSRTDVCKFKPYLMPDENTTGNVFDSASRR